MRIKSEQGKRKNEPNREFRHRLGIDGIEGGQASSCGITNNSVCIRQITRFLERYPSLEQVIPCGDPKWEITFSIDLLHDLVKVAKRAGDKQVTLRYLGVQDKEGAVLFALGNGKEYRGIICP